MDTVNIDGNELSDVYRLQRDTAQDSLAILEVQRRMLQRERDELRKRNAELEARVAELSPPAEPATAENPAD